MENQSENTEQDRNMIQSSISVFKDQVSEIKNSLENMDGQINMLDEFVPNLLEEISYLTKLVQEVKADRENSRNTSMKENVAKQSYICELFINTLNSDLRRMPLYSKISILFHVLALVISAIYIQDAYTSWQNALIVQSLAYMKVKDIPFPAITVCEPLLLREDFNRFEILKRCVSLENGTSWLCSEDELNMFRISVDVWKVEYDLLTLNYIDRNTFKKLYSPIFDFSVETLPVHLNRTFSAKEYLGYIDKLGRIFQSRVHIYNADLPGSPHREVDIRHGSASSSMLVAPEASSIQVCKKLNSKSDIFREKPTSNENHFQKEYKPESCKPENTFEKVCKDDFLFTNEFLEITFDDVNPALSPMAEFGNINLEFDQEQELDRKYKVLLETYILFNHYNFDHPSVTTMLHRLIHKDTTRVATITPHVVNVKSELIGVDKSERNCIFSQEKRLSIFEYYTRNNCILECQINCTIRLCGCIPYQTAILNTSFNICSNAYAKKCLEKSEFFIWHENIDKRCNCDCPSNCVSVTSSVVLRQKISDSTSNRKTSYQFNYEKDTVLSVVRYSVASPGEFVAYSLGILGVFNGFTMTFVWRAMYWITLGLWSTICHLERESP